MARHRMCSSFYVGGHFSSQGVMKPKVKHSILCVSTSYTIGPPGDLRAVHI